MIWAYLIVGKGEADRYLEEVLNQLWVDKIAICLNNVDDKTRKLCQQKGHLVIEDDREWGKNQWRIKEDFLKQIPLQNGDWVWCLDSDEIFDKRFTRERAEELMSSQTDISYQFWCIQLWDDENHWRPDMSFPNVRFWKYIPEFPMHWHPTPLHCGLAPEYAYKFPTDSGMIFKHYGLMTQEERDRRIARYDKYDPSEKYKAPSWYKGLKHGTYKPKPFYENDQFYAMLMDNNVILNHRKKLPKIIMKKREIYLFKNKHGKVVEAVGEVQFEQFKKTAGMIYLQDLKHSSGDVEAPVIKNEQPKVAEVSDVSKTTAKPDVNRRSSKTRSPRVRKQSSKPRATKKK